MTLAQLYCTVADLIADMQTPGADEAGLLQRIKEASDYLQKEIGWFIPVVETRKFHGHGRSILVIPPLLTLTSIVNDGITLLGSDYILQPDDRFWGNGPYGQLAIHPDAENLGEWQDEEDGVVIAGSWGLYSLSRSTGAAVKNAVQQAAADTTLVIDDASKISPGMVLLIEIEQQLVTGWSAPADSTANLNAAVAASDQIITLDDATRVQIGEVIRVDLEQMRITDINPISKQAAVIRGWNRTVAVAHLTNADVEVYRTVTVERGVNGTVAADHATDTAIARYAVPDDILFLTKEIATLMLSKARSGYQGRTGNAEGVIFYNDAFPKSDIERVKSNYALPRAH